MKRSARAAVIGRLRDNLQERGSWCGETHIQKAAFFLQSAAEVPLGYNFILYKHGPFSFDLREDLGGFRADGLLDLRPQSYPYGPRLMATDEGAALQERFPKTLGRYEEHITRVAEYVGDAGVAELERLATALLLLREREGASDADLAREMHRLKPHVTESQAATAVQDVRQFLQSLQTELSDA